MKDEYEWALLGNYNGKWEILFYCEDEQDAEQQLACYDENEPQYPHKIKSYKKSRGMLKTFDILRRV